MRLYLDDALLSGTSPQNLTEALDAARPKAAERGRIIVEIWTDGARVDNAELARLASEQELDASEVRLVTEDPRSVVKQALTETADSLDSMRAVHLQASDLIQSGKPEDAVELVGSIATVWDGVRRTMDEGGKLLGVKFEQMDGAPQAIASLTTRLSAMAVAIDRKDWVSLSDDLAEGLPEEAERWAVLLRNMADRVG
ncbi:MAG: hypothetical protein AB7G17_11430 [Phycisphaerales bacterium]